MPFSYRACHERRDGIVWRAVSDRQDGVYVTNPRFPTVQPVQLGAGIKDRKRILKPMHSCALLIGEAAVERNTKIAFNTIFRSCTVIPHPHFTGRCQRTPVSVAERLRERKRTLSSTYWASAFTTKVGLVGFPYRNRMITITTFVPLKQSPIKLPRHPDARGKPSHPRRPPAYHSTEHVRSVAYLKHRSPNKPRQPLTCDRCRRSREVAAPSADYPPIPWLSALSRRSPCPCPLRPPPRAPTVSRYFPAPPRSSRPRPPDRYRCHWSCCCCCCLLYLHFVMEAFCLMGRFMGLKGERRGTKGHIGSCLR